ncbi:MAG TPA: hypothetical protein VFV25_09765, partial [Methylibium sp.]
MEIGFEDDAPGFDSRAGQATAAAAAAADVLAAKPRTPVDTVHNELKAAEVLARFQAQRERWFAGLGEQTAGIERVLREEAAASDRLGGLPGTDHRAAWAPESAAGEAAVSAPQPGDQAAEWQPPLWAMAPVLRSTPGNLRLKLPASLDAAALQRALVEHCPPAWQRERVRVRLEIETRIYWG